MPRPWKEFGRYGSVGIELVLTVLIVGGIGHWLDLHYWPGKSWGLVVGSALGAAAGFRNLVRTALQMQRDIERAEAQDPSASRWTVDKSWLNDGTSHAPTGSDRTAVNPEDRETGGGNGPRN
jgi:hypothetical protein